MINDLIQKDWGIAGLHKRLLEILFDLNEFCSKYDIQYSLAYGSALGAIRHKGFIPWDDDVDVYMTLADYQKFRELVKQDSYMSNKYYLQEVDAISGMVELPKLRMNGTTYIEEIYESKSMHHGIYIDIFILHNAPQNRISRIKQYFASQYLTLKTLSNNHYKRKWVLVMKLLRIFPYNFLRKYCLDIVYKYNSEPSDDFFDTDLRVYSKSFYKKDTIFPVKYTKFADLDLPIPNKTHEYLSMIYGDYMIVPTIEKIESNQHAKIWDTEKDFRVYLPQIKDFSGEKVIEN